MRKFIHALIICLVLTALVAVAAHFVPVLDRAFIEKECGPLRPHKNPLMFEIDPSAKDRFDGARKAVASWSNAVNFPIGAIVPASPWAFDQFANALRGEGPEPVGRVLVTSYDVGKVLLQAGPRGRNDGHARIRYNTKTCEIGYVVIVLPEEPHSDDEWRVILEHEVGHSLGLEHDPSQKSVMYYDELEDVFRTKGMKVEATVTEEDAQRIRAFFEDRK